MVKYSCGYIEYYSGEINESICVLKACSMLCEKFVVGIPNDYVRGLICDVKHTNISSKSLATLLNETDFVDEVILLDFDLLDKKKAFEQIGFDACFYGTEYGMLFMDDKEYFGEKKVAFEWCNTFGACLPSSFNSIEDVNSSFILSLRNSGKYTKKVLFGDSQSVLDVALELESNSIFDFLVSITDSASCVKINNRTVTSIDLNVLKDNMQETLVIICGKNHVDLKAELDKIGKFDYRTIPRNDSVALVEELYIALIRQNDYLSRAHRALHYIIDNLNNICERHNINYYAICGTLLGVLRHNDIIPWDDDVDIAMTRSDFNKLKSVANTELKEKNIKLVDYNELDNGTFLDLMPRLYYLGENFETKIYDKAVKNGVKSDLADRMVVDIYILDAITEDERTRTKVTNKIKRAYAIAMGHRGKFEVSDYKHLTPVSLFLLKNVIRVSRLIPLSMISRYIEEQRNMFNGHSCKYYYMANRPPITEIERIVRQDYFKVPEKRPWGDGYILIRNDSEKLMTVMGYKDYTNYPRSEEMKPSHYYNSDLDIHYWKEKNTNNTRLLRSRSNNKKRLLINLPKEKVILDMANNFMLVRDRLSIINEYADLIECVCLINRQVLAIIDLISPSKGQVLRDIVKEFNKIEWKYIDIDDPLWDEEMLKFDAYYGTSCELSYFLSSKGVPVMITDLLWMVF